MNTIQATVAISAFATITALPTHASPVTNQTNASPERCIAIDAVPFVANRSGSYCLSRSLHLPSHSATAIWIKASDVTIDLKGHALHGAFRSCTETPTANGVGVRAAFNDGYKNIVVKNGLISGFRVGVGVAGSRFVAMTNLRIHNMRRLGIGAGSTGTLVVKDNQVANIGCPGTPATGVALAAQSGVVERNAIYGGDETVGMAVQGERFDVWNNQIVNSGETALAIDAHTTLTGNRIVNYGQRGQFGFDLNTGVEAISVRLRNNILGGYSEPIGTSDRAEVIDLGGNTIIF